MIKLLGNIPKTTFRIACSGGIDSMFSCDFFSRGKHNFIPTFFDHGTTTSQKALSFLKNRFNNHLEWGVISNPNRPKGKSWEEHWRDERNKFFQSFSEVIFTGQHLSDAVETWILGSIHGQPKLISYDNSIVRRPFLITSKSSIIEWVKKYGVEWIEDESNADVSFQRNKIRRDILPEILKINPGIEKTIRNKILDKYDQYKFLKENILKV